MTRNYEAAKVSHSWADTRETHQAVAAAIHAVADTKRTADMIWEAPTPAEWDHVTMAVEEYLVHGDFAREDDGRYAWGQVFVDVAPTNLIATALNDKGQAHVIAEIARLGLDWDAQATMTEIENMPDFHNVLTVGEVKLETPRGDIYINRDMVMTEVAA